MPDLDQVRNAGGIDGRKASFAYLCVKGPDDAAVLNADQQEKYVSYTKKLPALVKANGLGQVMAFMLTKRHKEPAYDLLLTQFGQYLGLHGLVRDEDLAAGQQAVIERLIGVDREAYRYATIAILDMLDWLRRFSDGMLRS